MAKVDNNSWKQLADQKEREWREVLESRIVALEEELAGKEKELFDEKAKFHELKEHFKYNLKLLEERDRELEKYDIGVQDIRNNLNSKTAEISELKIRIDDLKNVITREEKAKDELQANYQRRIREKQAEVDAYKSSKDGEVQGEREEYEKFRRDLHRQLASVQGELETQKRELITEFESALKKREHEFKLQKDELDAKVFEFDLKVKLLEKELELVTDSNEKTRGLVEETESSHRELEKQLKQKEWELTDVTAVKDAQIAELQSKLTASENNMKKLHEDFQRKYTELDRSVREREDKLERARTGYQEREQVLEAVKHELESRLEDAQVRERQALWAHQDELKEKELALEKLREELQDGRGRWDRHVAEISRSTVERDMELGSAREEQQRLREEVQRLKEDVKRYKKELKSANDREDQLDRAKVQSELDWQRRCDSLKSGQYRQSEELIDSLTEARNQAQALVRERERELHHKTLLVKSLHRERDQMRTLMKKYDVPLDAFVKYSIDSEETEEELNYVENLQRQNSDLKDLIAQMRSDMESLTKENLQAGSKLDSGDEEEIKGLKRENRELRHKLTSAERGKSPAPLSDQSALRKDQLHEAPVIDPSQVKQAMVEVENNSAVKSHILVLNATIGNLRSEKVELAATVKKQQVRIAFLENSLEEVSQQPRQKQIQIDQLTYELSTSRQRSEAEVAGLRKRVAEVELQLGEARREADEYHRAGLEANTELVALGNQLAAAKMEQSGSGATINFGAQELYIQQLQSELTQLRKRASALAPPLDTLHTNSSPGSSASERGGGGGTTTRLSKGEKQELRYKLRSAAPKIVQLAKENHLLTESNNRLRAELNDALAERKQSAAKDAGIVSSLGQPQAESEMNKNRTDNSGRVPSKSEDSDPRQASRLSQLEKLQYQLTKQELQFAHLVKEQPQRDIEGRQQRSNPVSWKDNAGLQETGFSVNTIGPREGINPRMLMSMSSGGGDSIQQVWQMLDESMTSVGQSEHIGQEKTDSYARGRLGDGGDEKAFVLEGQDPSARSPSGQGQSRRSTREKAIDYAEKVRRTTQQQQQQQQQKRKIRNYNIRDDGKSVR